MSYPTIRNFKDGTIIAPFPAACGGGTYTYSPPAPGPSSSYELTNLSYKSPLPAKDTDSFNKIKHSGLIKMTPLYRFKEQVTEYPVYIPAYSFRLGWPHCSDGSATSGQVKATSTWEYLANPLSFPVLDSEASEDVDISSELNALRAEVVSANLQTYDLLTELSEAKETAAMILQVLRSARNPLKAFRDFSKSISNQKGIDPKKAKEMIESKWMEYRYAIMPLVYSVEDITKLLKEKDNIFKTDRASRRFTVTVEPKSFPEQKGVYLYTRSRTEYRLSAVAKASYKPDALTSRLFDQIGINPFQTAWELIPFSFVVDWFANVGDWVLAQTSSLVDGSQQRVMCQSVKTVRKVETRLFVNLTYEAQKEYSTKPQPTGVVKAGPYQVRMDELMQLTQSEEYSRSLFNPTDVKLQVDIYLSWKRMIDAWILSQKPLISSLRSLK